MERGVAPANGRRVQADVAWTPCWRPLAPNLRACSRCMLTMLLAAAVGPPVLAGR